VIQLFLISAATEDNAVKTHDGFFCENSSYGVADRVFHDRQVRLAYRIPDAQVLDNIDSGQDSRQARQEPALRYLKAFGFGKTGIDLPGESARSLRPLKSWSA
jgi:cell division protein FtsI/penicillin-binding protein 2